MLSLDNLKIAAAVSAIAVAVIALGAGAVDARERGAGFGQMDFETLDANGDGEINEADFEQLRTNSFAEIDSDGDGSVTEEEFVARAAARASGRASEMFARLDADGDGAVSRDALEAREGGPRGGRILRRADTDNSGGVDAEEFAAAMERLAERGGRRN